MFHCVPPPDSAVQDLFYLILPCRRGVWGTKGCRYKIPGVYVCFLLQIQLAIQLDQDFPHISKHYLWLNSFLCTFSFVNLYSKHTFHLFQLLKSDSLSRCFPKPLFMCNSKMLWALQYFDSEQMKYH